MRIFMCVSETVKLNEFTNIATKAKISNMVHGITGLLSYNHGHYLHIIEGEDGAVSRLVANIYKDTRHQNVCEILDVTTDKRFFSDWSMKLVPLLKRNNSFLKFMDHVKNEVHALSQQQKRLLNNFYSIECKPMQPPKPVIRPTPLVYSIDRLPDFDDEQASSSLRSLCGSLMNTPTRFRDLLSQKYFGSQEQLRLMLNQLNRAGCLKVTQMHQFEDMRAVKMASANMWH